MSGENRVRAVAFDLSKPRMPRHVRLQLNELRERWVVLAPEKVYWPDAVTVDVLRLCNGERTVAEIAETLAKEYDAPVDVIKRDVLEFVQEWTDRRLLTL